MWEIAELAEPVSNSPLNAALFEPDTPVFRRLRRIENEYLLRSIAQSQSELIQFQKLSLCAQVGLSREVGTLSSVVSVLGESVVESLSSLSSQLSEVFSNLDEVLDLQYEQLDAIVELHEFLQVAFTETAKLLLANQQLLQQISDQLSRPYEMKALELRRQATLWLNHGMKSKGTAKTESYADALALYNETISNPIGNQDHAVWFDIGILKWKYEKNMPEARDAFHRAARLAEPYGDSYVSLALWHEAYMCYLLQLLPEAYESCVRAVATEREAHTLFDLARYAKLTHRNDWSQVLEEAVEKDPSLIVTMFSEVDFVGS